MSSLIGIVGKNINVYVLIDFLLRDITQVTRLDSQSTIINK